MTVRVSINHYEYVVEASSVRVAIGKALTSHDALAKRRQKSGLLTPATLSQSARKGGLRIYAEVPKTATPEGDDAPKKAKRVKRGAIR